MSHTKYAALVAVLAGAIGAGSAGATMMHPELGAHLSGMGMHGVVNLTSNTTTHKLCWSFDLMASGLTGASVRDATGMAVVHLGSMYASKGCVSVGTMTLDGLETKPGTYRVWVDTKNHPGDLRGTLFAGMASTSHI